MKQQRQNLLAIAAITLGAPTLHAADGTYNSQTGAWNLAGSWSGNVIASGTDSTAFFTNDVTTSVRTTSLGADRTIGNIVFTDADNTSDNGFNRIISGNILTFDVTSGRSSTNVTQSSRQLTFGGQLSGDDGIKLIGPGLVQFSNVNNDYSGGTEINAGTLLLANTGTAGSGTIYLGDTSGSANVELRMSATSTNISNALEVRSGSSGTKTLANRSSNSVTYSGDIIANANLTILGANSGGRLTTSGSGNTIANGMTVSFTNTGSTVNAMGNSATWGGQGGISYTSNSNMGFSVTKANTYSGGTTLDAMSGNGVLVATASSAGPANAPTSGAFGTGTLSIGATKMRGGDTADLTVGNAITFIDNPTFVTTANEKSLIFTGNASLGGTRTLTVETGSTVATAAVEFSGEISGSGFGITKEGAGTLVLSGNNTSSGTTTVSAGTLLVNGSLASDVSVSDTATLGGGGTVGAVSFAGGSFFDIALAIGGNTLDSTTISFSSAGFGIDNLRYNGAAVDWSTIANDTYTLITGTLDATDLDNFGLANAFDIGGGRGGYFEEGSLQLVVIPEPGTALLGGLGLLALLRRRR